MSDFATEELEHLESHVEPRISTPVRVRRWRPSAAASGSGSMLVGPHELGVQAVVPPGVLIRSADELSEEYNERGWRHVLWELDGAEPRPIDSRRPTVISPITSAVAIAHIRAASPEHLSWLTNQLTLRALAVQALLDRGGTAAPSGALREELGDLLLDCTSEFGHDWLVEHVAPRVVNVYELSDRRID